MKKRFFYSIVFFIAIFLSACTISAGTANVQTVEVTRIAIQTVEVTRVVQQTLIVTQYVTPIETPYPPPSLDLAYPPPSLEPAYPPPTTPTPKRSSTLTRTPFIKSPQRSPTLTHQQVSDKIAACYPEVEGCSACFPKTNNSVLHVVSTTRMFINVPRDLYPKELFQYATKINGQASMGYISNGGLAGEALERSPECYSTYVEFDGQGEVDLRIPSILIGVPDYFVRFIVE